MKVLDKNEALLGYKNVLFQSPPKNRTFPMELTHDYGKK